MAQSAHVDDHGMLEDSHSGLGGPGIFEKIAIHDVYHRSCITCCVCMLLSVLHAVQRKLHVASAIFDFYHTHGTGVFCNVTQAP